MEEVLIKDKQYSILESKIIALLHEIEGYIGKDKWEILDNLDSMYNEREAIIINRCEDCNK